MKSTFAGILTTACVLAGPIAGGAQQPANPWPGTRHLVVSKSTFRPGPAPKNRTFVIEAIEGGIKAKVSGDEANGTKLNFEYTATFDGKDYPVTGNSDVDATSFRRIDARTLESLRKKGGKLVSTMRFEVSSDGKVVTLTETMALWRSTMVKVSVLYPYSASGTFDMMYYLNTHIPMVQQKLGGAVKGAAVEQGLGGAQPGSPPAYLAMGHLLFDSVEAFQQSFAPHAEAILGDIPNYTNTQPIIQISEVKM